MPTLLVSGSIAEELERGPVEASLSVSIMAGHSENVIAWFGGGPSDVPFVLTTPLSAWFTSAGERGSGIAIVLELARELGEQFPVLVIGTSGHELDNLGVKRFLEDYGIDAPRAIMHVGASMAAGIPNATGELQLAPLRVWANRPDSDLTTDLAEALRPQGRFIPSPVGFLGEGQIWDAWLTEQGLVDVPLLSLAGTFPLFHTPDDVPSYATSPDLLEAVYAALQQAAFVLHAYA
jgi:hypothetical protein